ncbi:MAG: Flp pilus assembly complex ATPase component TadA [Anaerolineaceae bacterium]|nr:Flp pilus assembly complex ATPase component TadA [Anaerolineaceae bacterium]
MMAERRFVSGGTVQASKGIYIPRQSDEELYQLCLEGEYAAVLTARQRGKSSLMIDITDRLRSQGIHVATLDISPLGSDDADAWYFTILEIIVSPSNLNLNIDLNAWWENQARAYPLVARRFSLFFETVVLKEIQGRIIIFIDEIDKTFTLDFTDDFFIGIRAMYNQRSQNAEFQRLSFVLLGVASPTELIKAKTSTPYNIGRQLELADFTLEDLRPFQEVLQKQSKITEDNARFITYAIYSWTAGHPYLTQRLFREISLRSAEVKEWDQKSIDDLVDTLFLRPRTTSDSNISEVKQRLEFQRLVSNNAVELYFKILFTPVVSDDEEDFQSKTFLKLAGVVTTNEGRLEIRNRIYTRVVGLEWFQENYTKHFGKPPDELTARYQTRTMPVSSDLERLRSIEQEQPVFDDDLVFEDDDFEFDDFEFDDLDEEVNKETSKSRPASLRPSSDTEQASLASRRPRPSIRPGQIDRSYVDLKYRVQNKLMSELNKSMDGLQKNEVRIHIEELFNSILAEENILLARAERHRLFEAIIAEILGFGPLEPLLVDDTVSAIMVNGPKNVFIERKGQISRVNISFDNDDHVLRILDRIVTPLGLYLNESSPMVSFRMPDGSRGSAAIRPIALCGPSLTIRKFFKKPLTIEDLIRFGSMTPEIAEFMRACMIVGIQTVVVGGIGSGKQTLLNVLSSFIPNDERIVTVERVAELQLQQEHVVPLETRPPNIEGRGQVNLEDLAWLALQMQPHRIIFGDLEQDDGEAFLNACTRIGSCMATILAEDVEAALNFLEISVLRTSPNLQVEHIRNWVSSTIKLVIVMQRLRDGSRKVAQIVEITKLAPGRYGIEPIFEFEQTGYEMGRIIGRIRPTGRRPSFLPAIEAAGIHLPPSVFGVGYRY